MLLPFLALGFLVLDTGWTMFVKATLQNAVQEGARYAVTGQVSAGLGQVASVKAVVQSASLGFLTGTKAGTLSVQFLDGVSLKPTNSNIGGNLVQVSITNYPLQPLAPLFRSGNAVPVTVTAIDKIEGSPGGIPPTP